MDRLIRLRRDIHMHPELARQEFRTTSVISAALAEAGLEGRVLPSGTGLIIDIGTESGPLIGLRADIDALSIEDDKNVAHRSQVPGVCHACGHDVHAAILVGAAIELARSDLANFGRVRCIFQPAEESSVSGSLDMIAAGALDDPGFIDQAALSVVGRENVYKPPQSFGGEDFSWYLRDVPGAMFRLGVRAPGSTTQVDLHSGYFDVDERAIAVGVEMFTRIAIDAARARDSEQ